MSQPHKDTTPLNATVTASGSVSCWPRSDVAAVPSDLRTAQQVLTLEAASLTALNESLGDPFLGTIDMLMQIKGRIIVSGIGKSGHIARKIASTLASTGTPSFFIHPSEASHGDLGMVTVTDSVLALSNSGESSELCDIVAYTRRFAIPLVAITSNPHSMLARAADYVLCLPNIPEACQLGCAPTTSSIMMLALGDALAMTLLQRKGFSVEDFSTLHPGGTLGRTLVKVEKIMHGIESLPLVTQDVLMSEVIVLMSQKGFGCVGVLDHQRRLIGMVTDGDLRRHMRPDLLTLSVCVVMTSKPKVITAQMLAAEALRQMTHYQITSLFVVTAEEDIPPIPIGLVHVHDCLRFGVM